MTARGRFVEGTAVVLLLSGLANPPFRGPMLAAAAGLAATLVLDFHVYLPLLCGSEANDLSPADMIARLQLLLAINPPMGIALAWLAMLVAMMMPLIALPLFHVRNSSLASRRRRAAATFLLGYFGCWFLTAVPLLAAAITLRTTAGSTTAALVAAIALALLWSASPLQQTAQNRAHRLRRIGLFGFAADRDCVAYGAALGCWCVATCWAWMLVPLLTSAGHIFVMLAVSAIIMAERLRGPRPARWRVPEILALAIRWFRHRGIPGRQESAGGYV
jgi:predicted metal-binding membrane protein